MASPPTESGSVDQAFASFVRTGHPGDLARVFDETAPELLRLASHLVSDLSLAEDLVQSTFLTAIEGCHDYAPRRPVLHWLTGILTNRARELRRTIDRRPDPARLSSNSVQEPPQEVAATEFTAAVSNAIAGLPHPYRPVLMMNLKLGQQVQEIALVLGRAPGTVRKQLSRGMEMLRKALPRGLGVGAAALFLPDRSLAAVREVVLARASTASIPALTAALLGGSLIMKTKLMLAGIGVAAALLALWIVIPIPPADPQPITGEGRGSPLMATVEVPDENIARLPEADRQPVPSALGPTSATSLLVRVVERGTGTPVPGFGAALFPENAGWEMRDGVSDDQGEILWKNITWDPVSILPSSPRNYFGLEKDQLNERVHEVEFLFSVQGVVVDERDQPVAGAEVWQSLDQMELVALSRVAVTDAQGSFFFRVHASRWVSVFARSVGKAPSRIAFVSQPAEGQSVQLRLGIGDSAGAIVGDVVSPDGSPIEGARVQVRGNVQSLPPQEDPNFTIPRRHFAPLSTPVRTAATGKFRFEDVPVGEATVTVFVRGWAGAVSKVDVISGGRSQARITMSRGARVVGTVRDTRGEPLGGVGVSATRHRFAGRHGVSDGLGQYVLEGVQFGTVQLQATDPVRGSMNDVVELAEGEEFRWDPVFGAGASIQGVVLYHDGVPLSECLLLVTGEDGERRRIHTDTEGRFTVPHSKDQAYEVQAYPPGFPQPVSLATEVRPGEEELTYRLPRLPPADAYVVGRVLDPGGNPVAPVKISGREREYSNSSLQELTASDGQFRLGPILSGDWSFSFETSSHPTVEREITLPPGRTTDLGDISLEQAAPLEVLVRDFGGSEGRLAVHLWGPGIEDLRMGVDGGRVAFPPLRAGDYRLEMAGGDVPREVREFELVKGRETRVEIELKSGVPHTVGVVLPDGTESSVLQFTTYDSVGRELVSWQRRWYSYTAPRNWGFRSEALRLVVTSADGGRAEVALGSETEIQLVLR